MSLTRTAVVLLGMLVLVYGDHHHGPPAPPGNGIGDEVQETENATRDPQEIGQETTGAPAQQNVTRESGSSIPSDGSEQSTEQPQEDVTKDITSQPTTPSPVEENTTEEVSAVQSTTDVSATQSSGETTESTGNNSSVALNTREEPVTSGESRTQSPGNVSPTQRAAEDTTAPESDSVTSNVDSDISTTGTRGVDPTTQDTQADTTSVSPVKEVTSDSITPPSTSAPTVEGSSVTHDTEEGSATPGSPVTQDSAVSGTTADSQLTHKGTDSPSVEESSTPSGNENTGTSAPAEQDTATPEERHEGSGTPGTEERTNSDSAVEQGSSTQSPEEATDQPQPESSATQVVVDETDTTTKAVTPGAAQTTDEQGTATPSNATDAPSNEDQVTGKVPTRGDGTVEQGGQGGDGDGDKPIIDYGGIKAGTCPVEELGGFSICGGTPCRGDEDCPGTDKCCQRSCGKLCMAVPMELEPIDPIDVDGGSPPEGVADHPGVCPMDVGDSPMCTGTTCTNDGDCEGYEKCCFDFECGFDSVCMPAPQIQPVPVGPLGPVAPVGVAGHPGVCPEEVGGSPYCDGGLCIVDADCGPGEKCCSSITCAEGLRCMPAPQIQPVPPPSPRKGLCPMLTPTDLGNCEGQECVLDNECFDNEKCCGSACGYHCTMAILDMPDHPEIHLGTCPSVEAEGACGNAECIQDGDCAETEKCCGSSCGFHCTTLSIDIRIGGESLTPREQQCTGDLEFNDCAVTCQLTCAEPNVRPCVKMCGIGCYCPNGMLRESLESDRCYADISSCPLAVPEPEPVSRECTGDLTFNDCGTACEQSCDHPEPMMCTRQCVPGCFCPFGSLRVSLDTDTCVTIEADRPNDANCPSKPGPVSRECTGDLTFNDCGTACEQSCDHPEPMMCTRQCVPGCFCPFGSLRVSLDTDTCVTIEADRPNDANCPSTGDTRPCENERRMKMEESGDKEGIFIPQCTQDGLYAMEQCYEGNGSYCWCADPQTGMVIPDSEVHGVRADCERFIPDPSLLNQCPEGKVFAEGVKKCVVPEPEPEPLAPECPGDFVMNECNSACPEYCGKPEGLLCITMCLTGCGCPVGTVMQSEDSTVCIPAEQCTVSFCEGDLVFNDCGSACPSVCNEPEPMICTIQCVLECQCPSGMHRVAGTSRCVAQEACPESCAEGYKHNEMLECVVAKPCPEKLADALEGGLLLGEFSPECTEEGKYMEVQCSGSTGYCWCVDIETGVTKQGTDVRGTPDCSVPVPEPEPLAPECPGDFVMNECNSACPEYCGKEEGLACIEVCLTGCGCPVGTVMQSEDSTVCIPAEQCPVLCDGDLVFNDCGTACPSVCNEPEPLFCTYQCVLECQCPSEMHRVAGTSRCVAQEACPESCAEGYKHNEMLECVVAKPCPEKLADALEGGLLIGEFSPECTEEGKYMEVQCSGSTGYCWCVDIETGVTKQGTDVRGTPDCSAPVPTCEGDLTYQTCGSACPSVCNQPEQICIFSCSVGCQCLPGMYLVPGEDPPRCVDFADCPAEPTCEGDLVYQSCGTACPSVCNVPPPQACTSQCVSECQCPYGEYRVPDENPPRCVPYEGCPTPACDNGMHFEICGKECPNYCGKPDDEYCISFCKPGCVCPEGTILIDLETDMCVPQEDCPGAIIPVAVETILRVDFQCPAKRGRCPYGLAESTDLACTVECGDDYDCEGERKCCSHTCGSICTYPDFPVPQPDPSRFPPVPTSPPAMGISADICPAADVAPASCGLTCSADEDCSSGELCCTNNACEGSVCLPFVTEQMCTTVPCPVFEASGPRDFEQKICGSDYIFIVKIRSDGRAKILDDLKWRSNPYADASNRPIISFIMDDVCTFQMTKERYVLFMDGNAADMDTKELTLDHTVLVIPLTGHLKNDVKMLSDRCPIA